MDLKSETKTQIASAVLSVSEKDWHDLFEFLRYQQYIKLASTTTEEQRLELATSVKGINNLESVFKRIHSDKKFA